MSPPRRFLSWGRLASALIVAVALAPAEGLRPAQAAGGAYAVDDVETGSVGQCKIESWMSFANNRDFVGAVSPTCVVNLGRPVELIGGYSRIRSSGEWGSVFVFKAKTNLIPIEPNKVGLGLIAGTSVDLVSRGVNGVFLSAPVTFQLHEQVRINGNGGWLWDPLTARHHATWGAGFEWNFVKPLTLIGEVFGIAGTGQNSNPRAQLGLRYTPVEAYDVDVIYGRNLTGENAHWITVGLNVRFNVLGRAK
jgi:hypothetical protein